MSFTALAAMGVQNPEQIARYSTYMSDNIDILRIVYDRKKGSILPVSRKYRFPRIKKNELVDSGTRQTNVIYESSPQFRSALGELDQLMDARDSSVEIKKLIIEEVASLEEEVAARTAYIRSLVERL